MRSRRHCEGAPDEGEGKEDEQPDLDDKERKEGGAGDHEGAGEERELELREEVPADPPPPQCNRNGYRRCRHNRTFRRSSPWRRRGRPRRWVHRPPPLGAAPHAITMQLPCNCHAIVVIVIAGSVRIEFALRVMDLRDRASKLESTAMSQRCFVSRRQKHILREAYCS